MMETGSMADKMREKTARKKEPGCSRRDNKLVFFVGTSGKEDGAA
jgi:hypothetical protein